jgi:hypothetical protein
MDLNCAICFESIDNFKDKKTLPCEHMYHKCCINQVQNNKCPLCKGDIIDGKIKAYENLYFSVCKQLRFVEIENEKLKKTDYIDNNILKSINDGIINSIKKNKYVKNIKNHYNIDITCNMTTPLHCKHCNFKTSKYGFLYNHVNNKHYEVVNNLS